MRVVLSGQVVEFVRRLPPGPRRRVRQALRGLMKEQGDVRALEGPLDGYLRLRVGGYRIVFSYRGRGTIECIFAERRSLVYEMLLDAMRARLKG